MPSMPAIQQEASTTTGGAFFDKQTVITMGASIVLGFVADLFVYAWGRKKAEGKFRFALPTKEDALILLIVGGVVGWGIDAAVKEITWIVMSDQEKALTTLTDAEVAKIRAGLRAGQTPISVLYQALTGGNTAAGTDATVAATA